MHQLAERVRYLEVEAHRRYLSLAEMAIVVASIVAGVIAAGGISQLIWADFINEIAQAPLKTTILGLSATLFFAAIALGLYKVRIAGMFSREIEFRSSLISEKIEAKRKINNKPESQNPNVA